MRFKGGRNKFQGVACVCRNCKHQAQGMKPGQRHRRCGGEWVTADEWSKEQARKEV